jgi:hypothetical protein
MVTLFIFIATAFIFIATAKIETNKAQEYLLKYNYTNKKKIS